ncbi:MAG: hypothetical protein H7841_11095 [Magnetospirillum sp. WYHS-4]
MAVDSVASSVARPVSPRERVFQARDGNQAADRSQDRDTADIRAQEDSRVDAARRIRAEQNAQAATERSGDLRAYQQDQNARAVEEDSAQRRQALVRGAEVAAQERRDTTNETNRQFQRAEIERANAAYAAQQQQQAQQRETQRRQDDNRAFEQTRREEVQATEQASVNLTA